MATGCRMPTPPTTPLRGRCHRRCRPGHRPRSWHKTAAAVAVGPAAGGGKLLARSGHLLMTAREDPPCSSCPPALPSETTIAIVSPKKSPPLLCWNEERAGRWTQRAVCRSALPRPRCALSVLQLFTIHPRGHESGLLLLRVGAAENFRFRMFMFGSCAASRLVRIPSKATNGFLCPTRILSWDNDRLRASLPARSLDGTRTAANLLQSGTFHTPIRKHLRPELRIFPCCSTFISSTKFPPWIFDEASSLLEGPFSSSCAGYEGSCRE